jgi:hypothetical protein
VESVRGKRKFTADDTVSEMQARKQEWEDKQKQAEKMINEGTEQLTVSIQTGKATMFFHPRLYWSLETSC